MSLWRQWRRGAHSLLHARAADQDIADEVRQYFEEATAAGMARGLSAQDARRAARLELGNMTAVQEQLRSQGWENIIRAIGADLRYAARQLRHNPAFALITALTLALGIGACTAIFSAVGPILFEPLPYPQAGRIMMIWNSYAGDRAEIAFGSYRELLERSHSFAAMSAFEPWQPAMKGGAQAERLEGQAVSASYLHVLGVAPLLGRDFQAADDVFNGPRVVILSDRLWRRLFHGDPAAIGRTIKLDDDNYTVIGVMPSSFDNVLSPSAALWTPMQYDTRLLTSNFETGEWGLHLHMVARLRPGVSREQATHELYQVAHTPRADYPRPRWASLRHGLIVDSLQDDMAHGIKPALLAVLGAVFLLLTIACVNVTNLSLARSAQRQGEFAVRAALGASRGRILRQLITESALLACIGGVLGLGVAVAGIHALIALSPPGLPRLNDIALNRAAFLFAFAITSLVGLLTGLLPALRAAQREVQPALQRSSRRTASGQSWTRSSLVVTEVALALILLINAGLLLRSMQHLLAVDPGFRTSHLLTLQVQTSGHQFDERPAAPGAGNAARRRFFVQALDAVRRVPGVRQAAFTSLLPLSDDPPVVGLYGAQFENDGPQGGRNVFRYAVSPDYCPTMGIPLRRGRLLDERDTASAPQAALISESLAKLQFPGQDPLGKRLHLGPKDRPWYTVVGVVGDVKQTSLAIDQPNAVYLSTEQTWFADEALSFVVRTYGDAAALAPAIEHAVWSVDDQPIVRVMTMEKLFAVSESQRRFVLTLFATFGLAALALAAVGIYGVLSGSVTERTREIGVRVALGATRADILSLVLGQGMRLTLIGAGMGLACSAIASHALTTLLYGVSQLDPATYCGVALLLACACAIACWTPAWRAAQVDPSITLRAE